MKVNMIPRSGSIAIPNKIIFVEARTQANFLQQLEMEVIQNPTEARRLVSSMRMVSMSVLPLSYPLMSSVVPPELVTTAFIIIGVLAFIAVATSVITLMLSGLWKSLMGGKKSDEWTQNIIKGLMQVLGAPIIVALIVGIFTLLFSHVPAFQPLIDPIGTFFHH